MHSYEGHFRFFFFMSKDHIVLCVNAFSKNISFRSFSSSTAFSTYYDVILLVRFIFSLYVCGYICVGVYACMCIYVHGGQRHQIHEAVVTGHCEASAMGAGRIWVL